MRWTGYDLRMGNSRIPNIMFFGELANGSRAQCGQFKRFKDDIKKHLQEGCADVSRWKLITKDITGWRTLVNQTVQKIKQKHVPW
mgnify:CR=1 FL=1